MIATLKFKLPEEQADFDMACRAGAMSSAIWDVLQAFRARDKHGEQETTWEEARLLLLEHLGEFNQ